MLKKLTFLELLDTLVKRVNRFEKEKINIALNEKELEDIKKLLSEEFPIILSSFSTDGRGLYFFSAQTYLGSRLNNTGKDFLGIISVGYKISSFIYPAAGEKTPYKAVKLIEKKLLKIKKDVKLIVSVRTSAISKYLLTFERKLKKKGFFVELNGQASTYFLEYKIRREYYQYKKMIKKDKVLPVEISVYVPILLKMLVANKGRYYSDTMLYGDKKLRRKIKAILI